MARMLEPLIASQAYQGGCMIKRCVKKQSALRQEGRARNGLHFLVYHPLQYRPKQQAGPFLDTKRAAVFCKRARGRDLCRRITAEIKTSAFYLCAVARNTLLAGDYRGSLRISSHRGRLGSREISSSFL